MIETKLTSPTEIIKDEKRHEWEPKKTTSRQHLKT